MSSTAANWEVLARNLKEQGCYEMAQNAMRHAQALWEKRQLQASPGMPDFSPQQWHEIYIAEVLARSHKERGYHEMARNAMRRAQVLWETRQLEASMHMPDFSPQEWREIEIVSVQGFLQKFERAQFNCPVCFDDFEAGLRHDDCGQMICRKCINIWSIYGTTCPLCRGALE